MKRKILHFQEIIMNEAPAVADVQVRAANGGARDTKNEIVGFLDFWLGNVIN
jgi:hypothetical protein